MNGDACVSRHVRLVAMYRRFTVRDKQGGVWHSFQVFQAAYWGHHFVSHNKTWPAVINRMLQCILQFRENISTLHILYTLREC